jgi:S1-C subfamily serine protease
VTSGDLLDIVLALTVLGFALSGYRQGFVVGVLSLVGLLGGGLIGAELAGPIADRVGEEYPRPLIGLLSVLVGSIVGLLVTSTLGAAVRARMTHSSIRAVDGLGGAAVSALAVLLVAWLLGTAVNASPYRDAAQAVQSSRVLTAVDDALPPRAAVIASSLRQLVDAQAFPEVFGGLRPQPVPDAPAPDPALAGSPAVEIAAASTVRVFGERERCPGGSTGTGFVFAPERVMTNAHVLAGVGAPTVQIGGSTLSATTVYFDAGTDVAVLAVPGLGAPALSFAGAAPPGADAIVAGHPGGGPFVAGSARVRQQQRARGLDIYQGSPVTRDVYALVADVRPGNSGGPLLDPAGDVYGVIFAAAADRPDVGYALTAEQVAEAASVGAGATGEVATGRCV